MVLAKATLATVRNRMDKHIHGIPLTAIFESSYHYLRPGMQDELKRNRNTQKSTRNQEKSKPGPDLCDNSQP